MDKNSYYFVAGTLVLVLSCVLLYRYGNLLDRTVSPPAEDLEAPLQDLVKFIPSAEDPTEIQFSTLEKTDRTTGKTKPARMVPWPVGLDSSILDPLKVIDKYAQAHGMSRVNLEGPILKAKSARGGKSLVFNSFTRQDYGIWIEQLIERLGLDLKSLNGHKLTPAILRRTAMTYFASITSVKNVQALAGHKNITTTANIYIGLRDDENAMLRASLSCFLLGDTQEKHNIPVNSRLPFVSKESGTRSR
jgi:hypothetical protein